MDKKKIEIKLGDPGYVNRNCWLADNVNYPPSKRCQYCQSKFSNCLFSRYLLISLVLVFLVVAMSFLVERDISKTLIVSIFLFILVYGYFFNKSTEDIVGSSFNEKKAKEAFKELSATLKQRVDEQTKDLKHQAEHLQKLLTMRSEFLDIASHQLKTPVSVILGTASMFKEGCMDKLPKEQQAKFVGNIFYKAKKLSVIISDILRASEMDTDEFKLSEASIKPTQVEEIIKAVHEDLKPLAEEKQIKLQYQKSKQPVSQIMSSADFLEQAIYNLVDNAIKYTAKGSVKISLSEAGSRTIIKVEDTGIGIPEGDKKKMFDKFARAKNAVNMYTDGSGLGIFIVKKIVEAHKGGQIGFESEEGKGTVFTISFPSVKEKVREKIRV